jgi:hypothetical protein
LLDRLKLCASECPIKLKGLKGKLTTSADWLQSEP